MSKIIEKNNKQQINISKQGVQISYRRFLSDSAGGFLFLGSILLMIRLQVAPFNSLDIGSLESMSTEAKAFFLLLAFLLATPIGLLMNAASWFTFGIFDLNRIGKIASGNSFMARGTKAVYRFDNLIKFFKIENVKEDFFDRAIEIKEIIDFYYPQLSREIDTSTGARRLIRSFSLISVFVIILLSIGIGLTPSIWKINLTIIGILCVAIFYFVSIQSYLRFYDILHTLSNAYLICVPKQNELKDIGAIKKHLIEEHSKKEEENKKEKEGEK